MSIKMKLMMAKRKEQRLKDVDSFKENQRLHFERDLKEVFSITYTDYCSLRTKRKLDGIVNKPSHRMTSFTVQSVHKSKSKEDCLKILSMKGTDYAKGFIQRQNRSRLISKGTIITESRISRDWLSKKIMQLQFLQGKWGEANGHRMTLEKPPRKTRNQPKRYNFRSLTAQAYKSRPISSVMQKAQRQKTLFQRTLHERGLTTLSQPQVINGWQNDTNDYQ